ncbi:MAG TPA: PilZ domain-containing protein [Planctomycetota bacterium]|nr:PilZ domain-containing protein [Planctomycetota bacterium]
MTENNQANRPDQASNLRAHERYRIKGGAVKYTQTRFLGLFKKSSQKHLILDLSESGMQFMTKREFKKQALLSLDISAPSLEKDVIHTRGRVAWVRKAPGLVAYGVGIRFESMEQPEKDKLAGLININKPNKDNVPEGARLKKINEL